MLTYITLLAHIVAALFVLNLLLRTPATAGEGHTTGLATANGNGGAIEVVVAIPILGPVNATALQPILLYPVYEILLIWILTIVLDKGSQTLRGLVLDLHKYETCK